MCTLLLMARLRDRRELAAGVMTLFAVSLIGLTAGAIAPGAGKQRGGDQAVLFLSSPRVVVLKAKRALHLFDGEVLVRSYSIDLGTDPSGPKLRQGDGRTAVKR